MCTVTFIPVSGKLFITHSRDEKSKRAKALPPREYNVGGHPLIFPRDTAAGGTWIALHENGSAAVLLNGGFVKHITKPPYRKSRGIAFLDIVAANDPLLSYKRIDLAGIEPFTLLLWSEDQLTECRWDGQQKHIKGMDSFHSHIWSSVTLYDEEVISRRSSWFDNWKGNYPRPDRDEIIAFHLFGGDGDGHNDLRMNRDGQMLTVSITAIEITNNKASMKYLDLQDNSIHLNECMFTKVATEK